MRYTNLKPPVCKCGKYCQYYGAVGGFSVKCEACNAKNAKRQRDARARKRDDR